MSFRLLFNLILLGCFGLSWVGSSLFFNHEMNALSDEAVAAEARLQMQASLAIREYTQSFVRPYLDAHPAGGFAEISVPAFASRQTLDLLYRHYPGYRYREAALNPTNPKDKASGWEVDLIERFRSVGPENDRVEIVHSDDGSSLNAAKPIRITNQACLRCHGKVEDAPVALRERYPSLGGFGWKMGEVVGAQIVTVPKQDHLARFQAVHESFQVAFFLIFGTIFVLMNVLLEGFVLRPLQLNNRELSSMADTDPLTAVPNRRAFDQALNREIAASSRSGEPLSVMVMDIDHFKSINDAFGHGVGDEVLQLFAAEISRKFRAADVFARLGGEEFVALLPGVALEEATQKSHKVLKHCASLDFNIGRPVTVSIGVAQWRADESAKVLVQRGDSALYMAKQKGRNRVEVAA